MTREEIETFKRNCHCALAHGATNDSLAVSGLAVVRALEAAWAKNDALLDTITLTTDLESRLRQRIRELERGEYICKRCGLRNDGESQPADF